MLGHSARIARAIDADRLLAADVEAVRAVIAPEITQERVGLVEVYRIVRTPGAQPTAEPIVSVQSPSLPRGHVRATSDRLAERVAAGSEVRAQHDSIDAGGELVRAPALVVTRSGTPVGVVVASDHLRDRSRRTPGASSTPMKATASCASCAGRSKASTSPFSC